MRAGRSGRERGRGVGKGRVRYEKLRRMKLEKYGSDDDGGNGEE